MHAHGGLQGRTGGAFRRERKGRKEGGRKGGRGWLWRDGVTRDPESVFFYL